MFNISSHIWNNRKHPMEKSPCNAVKLLMLMCIHHHMLTVMTNCVSRDTISRRPNVNAPMKTYNSQHTHIYICKHNSVSHLCTHWDMNSFMFFWLHKRCTLWFYVIKWLGGTALTNIRGCIQQDVTHTIIVDLLL